MRLRAGLDKRDAALQVGHRQREVRRYGVDHLDRPAVALDKPGAQRLVPADQRAHGPFQRGDVQRTVQPQRRREVVHRRRGVQPVQEPQALLLVRARQRVAARHRYDRVRVGRAFALVEPGGQVFQHLTGEHVLRLELDPQALADAGEELGGVQ